MNKKQPSFNDEGFKIPKGYFEAFEERLEEKRLLDGFDTHKNQGFKVPDLYFNDFEERLKIRTREAKVVTLWPIDRRIITGALATAAAALIAVLVLWNPEQPQTNFESISATALNEYLAEEGIQEFITEEDLTRIEDNATLFSSFTMSDELFYEVVDKQVLEDELEPQIPLEDKNNTYVNEK